jgi:hypothetical protein
LVFGDAGQRKFRRGEGLSAFCRWTFFLSLFAVDSTSFCCQNALAQRRKVGLATGEVMTEEIWSQVKFEEAKGGRIEGKRLVEI